MIFPLLLLLCSPCVQGLGALEPDHEIGGVPVYNYGSGLQDPDTESEWIVVTKPELDDDKVGKICDDSKGCEAGGHPSTGGIGFVALKANEHELKDLIKKHPGEFDFLEPTHKVHAFRSNRSLNALRGDTDRWNLDRIDGIGGINGEFNPDSTGKGVHVYILDTGIFASHEDFEGRAVAEVDTNPWGKKGANKARVCSKGDSKCGLDTEGHGTHCAGTAGGKRSGAAKDVQLHGVKILDDKGEAFNAQVIAGMDWVAANAEKPAIMSMSLGGYGQSRADKVAVEAAVKRGITVVVAAGNEEDDACEYTPAFVPDAISVGATDHTDARVDFSNYGKCVDIWAPGTKILSAIAKNGAYIADDGTSMACPLVAGAAALLLEKDPKMKPRDVMKELQKTGQGVVTDTKGATEKLLFVGDGGGPEPAPAPPPSKGGGKGGKGSSPPPSSPTPSSPPSSPTPSSPTPGGGGGDPGKGGKGGKGSFPSPSPTPGGGDAGKGKGGLPGGGDAGKGGKVGKGGTPLSPTPSTQSPTPSPPGDEEEEEEEESRRRRRRRRRSE